MKTGERSPGNVSNSTSQAVSISTDRTVCTGRNPGNVPNLAGFTCLVHAIRRRIHRSTGQGSELAAAPTAGPSAGAAATGSLACIAGTVIPVTCARILQDDYAIRVIVDKAPLCRGCWLCGLEDLNLKHSRAGRNCRFGLVTHYCRCWCGGARLHASRDCCSRRIACHEGM